MVRRNDKVAFMAGAFVFPGGRVDDADRLADPASLCDGLDGLPRFPDLNAEDELAYRVAAIRELEEEASILLARRDGRLVDRHAAEEVRQQMGRTAGLPAAIEARGLRLAVDAVLPIAHWVTPEIETRRYDTRFFLASMPADQDPRHDAGETTELMWVGPADALARCRAGEIMLPPPTWTTLARLARMSAFDEVITWATNARIVRIQPGFIQDGASTMLTLPGDPLHPAAAEWETPEETRFILEEGRGWRATRS